MIEKHLDLTDSAVNPLACCVRHKQQVKNSLNLQILVQNAVAELEMKEMQAHNQLGNDRFHAVR